MTTVTLSQHASSGYLSSSSVGGNYSEARDGTGTLAVGAGAAKAGQEKTSGGVHVCYQTFVAFDTTVPAGFTVSSVSLQVDFSTLSHTPEWIIEARSQSWLSGGLTTADFVAGASLSGLTLLASLDTTGISTHPQSLVSSGSFISSLNTSGQTEIMISSSKQRIGTAPVNNGDTAYVIEVTPHWQLLLEYNEVSSSYNERIVPTGNRWRA